MKLITNERTWRKFLRDAVGMYRDDVRLQRSWAGPGYKPTFPCFGYAVVESFGYEEQRPMYLTQAHLESMTEELEMSKWAKTTA